MKRFLIPLAATLFVTSACYAEAVIKCTTESGVTYQATPCLEDAATTATAPSPTTPGWHPAGGPPPPIIVPAWHPTAGPVAPMPNPSSQVAILSRGNELKAGMSDLQVLNNRRWGKPQHIARHRDARAWHEYWDYNTGANGGKQLHFVNGTLASIEDLNPAPAVDKVSVAMVQEP